MDSGSDDAGPPGDVELRRRFDWGRTPPSVAVVSAIAEARGVDDDGRRTAVRHG